MGSFCWQTCSTFWGVNFTARQVRNLIIMSFCVGGFETRPCWSFEGDWPCGKHKSDSFWRPIGGVFFLQSMHVMCLLNEHKWTSKIVNSLLGLKSGVFASWSREGIFERSDVALLERWDNRPSNFVRRVQARAPYVIKVQRQHKPNYHISLKHINEAKFTL